jgi:alkylmercury lyase
MAKRLSSAGLDHLVDAVTGSDAITGAREPHAVRALYRLLGFDGRPVSAGRLAAAVGWDEARGRAFLDELPNAERDADGSVVGFGGLTLRPTPHEMVVAGQVRHTWCAWDTLFLPVALAVTVEVRSRCPQTGRAVVLTVTPAGVQRCVPDEVVLGFVHPDAIDAGDLRGSFCGHVDFLVGQAAAERHREAGASRLVLDLEDAFELGRRMIANRCAGSAARQDEGESGWTP